MFYPYLSLSLSIQNFILFCMIWKMFHFGGWNGRKRLPKGWCGSFGEELRNEDMRSRGFWFGSIEPNIHSHSGSEEQAAHSAVAAAWLCLCSAAQRVKSRTAQTSSPSVTVTTWGWNIPCMFTHRKYLNKYKQCNEGKRAQTHTHTHAPSFFLPASEWSRPLLTASMWCQRSGLAAGVDALIATKSTDKGDTHLKPPPSPTGSFSPPKCKILIKVCAVFAGWHSFHFQMKSSTHKLCTIKHSDY